MKYVINLLRNIGLNVVDESFVCSLDNEEAFNRLSVSLSEGFSEAGILEDLIYKREPNFVKLYIQIKR